MGGCRFDVDSTSDQRSLHMECPAWDTSPLSLLIAPALWLRDGRYVQNVLEQVQTVLAKDNYFVPIENVLIVFIRTWC